jgi:hypothetical protein|tara:strand:+ start:228 stop:599 length:372 start_codon:yes stop_codon:yes gene_type:complete
MKKSDYFEYSFIHPNGGKNIDIKIPQSYVKWRTTRHKNKEIEVPDGFTKEGNSLIESAREQAMLVPKQIKLVNGEPIGEFNSNSYFQTQRASSGKLDSKQRQHLQGLKDEEMKQEEQLDEEKI